jgi:hypothetical protein
MIRNRKQEQVAVAGAGCGFAAFRAVRLCLTGALCLILRLCLWWYPEAQPLREEKQSVRHSLTARKAASRKRWQKAESK